jgi:hypothetical protein
MAFTSTLTVILLCTMRSFGLQAHEKASYMILNSIFSHLIIKLARFVKKNIKTIAVGLKCLFETGE